MVVSQRYYLTVPMAQIYRSNPKIMVKECRLNGARGQARNPR